MEDLGLNPLYVQMQAVFYGAGYYTDFKKFLSAMQKQGADTLVHPIRGRLQNMLCISARFHHDAEFVDYVQVDLIFLEATPAKPIFVFGNALFALVDELLNAVEEFIDDILDFFGALMEATAFAQNIKSRVLGAYGAIFSCYEQLRELFDFDKTRYNASPSVSASDFTVKTGRRCVILPK